MGLWPAADLQPGTRKENCGDRGRINTFSLQYFFKAVWNPGEWRCVGRWVCGCLGKQSHGMRGGMAKARALSILSALFVLTAGSVGGHAVRAEDTCLSAPTGKTPPGSHWHYRTDPVKQTKCWYVRSDAGQPAAATDGADTAGAAAKPAAAPKPAADGTGAESHPHKPHQAARAGAGAKPAPAGAQSAPQAASPMQGAQTNSPPAQPVQGATPPWPDPQPQSAAGNVAWPEPPSAAPSAAMSAPPDTTTTTNTPPEPPAAGQDTGSINGNSGNDVSPAEASPPQPPAQNGDVSGSTILALAIAMAFVGILMRWLVGRLFARRRKLAAERREPVWVTDEYVMPDALTRGTRLPPDRVDPERLDDEVKHALRKLLRTLERSAA